MMDVLDSPYAADRYLTYCWCDEPCNLRRLHVRKVCAVVAECRKGDDVAGRFCYGVLDHDGDHDYGDGWTA